MLIDFIEKPSTDPASLILARMLEEASKPSPLCKLVTSVITISEVFYAKREADKKVLSPEVQAAIDLLWHPDSSPIETVAAHEIIAREAHNLLRSGVTNGWCKTRGADGIHLITAKREGAKEFWTTERAMKKWCGGLGFDVELPNSKFLIKEDDAPLYDGIQHDKS